MDDLALPFPDFLQRRYKPAPALPVPLSENLLQAVVERDLAAKQEEQPLLGGKVVAGYHVLVLHLQGEAAHRVVPVHDTDTGSGGEDGMVVGRVAELGCLGQLQGVGRVHLVWQRVLGDGGYCHALAADPSH